MYSMFSFFSLSLARFLSISAHFFCYSPIILTVCPFFNEQNNVIDTDTHHTFKHNWISLIGVTKRKTEQLKGFTVM